MNIFIIDFLNNIFVNSTKYVSVVSPFLANALVDNWNGLNNITITKSAKKVRANYIKNLKKISELEQKKEIDIKEVIKGNITLIREIQDGVDKEYADNLVKRMRKISSFEELFLMLLDRFETSMPREPKRRNKSRNVKYIVDESGYVYANMTYKNGVLTFDKRSFENEVLIFDNSLINDNDLVLEIPENVGNKIAPSERKRRIYIEEMYKLNRAIFKMTKKSLDILYPIDKFYEFATIIVANLYKELIEYNTNEMVLNKLWQETIKNYGGLRSLSIYNEAYQDFVKRYKGLRKEVFKEYKDVIMLEKQKKENVAFSKTKNPIPSVADIFSALASIIIQKINDNVSFYTVDFDHRIHESIKYMNIRELVFFYRTFKSVINKDSRLIKYYPNLQKCIAKEISLSNGKSLAVCVKKYLREEVIF